MTAEQARSVPRPTERAPETGFCSATGYRDNPQVQPVIKALRPGGIDIVEVHHHRLDEQPRLFYVHFWEDDAVKLARALAEAIRAHDVSPVG